MASPEFGKDLLTNSDYNTIAVLRTGDVSYLVRSGKQGQVAFAPINPLTQQALFQTETRALRQDSFISFEGADAPNATIAIVGLAPTSVRWVERSQGAEEPLVTISAADAVKNVPVSITLTGQEIEHLFIETGSGYLADSADFFIIPTSDEDIISLVLRRPNPVILNIIPGNDGVNLTPMEGLQNFLSSIYDNLAGNLTPVERIVERRVRMALETPNGPVKFRAGDGTPALQRQREIQKYLYQIKALIIARRAELRNGIKDTDLIALVPFLEDVDDTKTGNLSREGGVFGKLLHVQPENPLGYGRRHEVLIDDTLWSNILAKPGVGYLLGEKKNAIPATPVKTPVVEAFPKPVSFPARPEAIYPSPPAKAPPSPIAATINQPTEVNPLAAKVVEQAPKVFEIPAPVQEIRVLLQQITSFLKNIDILHARTQELQSLNNLLKTVAAAADKDLFSLPGTVEPDTNFTSVTATPRDLTIGIIHYPQIFEYMTGNDSVHYADKAEKAVSALEKQVTPVVTGTFSAQDRLFGAFKQNSAFRRSNPQPYAAVITAMTTLFTKVNITSADQDSMDVTITSSYILTAQLVSSLLDRFSDITKRTNPNEFKSWAVFAAKMIDRLQSAIEKIVK